MRCLAALLMALPVISAFPTINVTGNAFLNSSSGERFYIRGVDYQPGGSSNLTDPLADETICKRDIPIFEELGLNTIRVYSVDNSADHDTCMKLLAKAGIYLILDLNTPDASLSRDDTECSYNSVYLQNVFATVDAFANYTNVLGFFAGNEVINSANTTYTAPYVKAVVRDVKNYLKARKYREIPVGYSAADVTSNRLLAAEYFNCGNDSDARIDFFGVNDYSWCGDSSYQVSGWEEKVEMYSGYSIPIFLSEFGCNTVGDSRKFTEIEALYSEDMSAVFSGGLVYEYSNETNNYGLVQIVNDTKVKKLTDFYNLQKQYNSTEDPIDADYTTDNDISECPAYDGDTWDANTTLPELPKKASAYYKSGAGEPLGTDIGNTQSDCYDDDDDDDDDDDSDSSASKSSKRSSSKHSSSKHSSSKSSSSKHGSSSQSAHKSSKATSKSSSTHASSTHKSSSTHASSKSTKSSSGSKSSSKSSDSGDDNKGASVSKAAGNAVAVPGVLNLFTQGSFFGLIFAFLLTSVAAVLM